MFVADLSYKVRIDGFSRVRRQAVSEDKVVCPLLYLLGGTIVVGPSMIAAFLMVEQGKSYKKRFGGTRSIRGFGMRLAVDGIEVKGRIGVQRKI